MTLRLRSTAIIDGKPHTVSRNIEPLSLMWRGVLCLSVALVGVGLCVMVWQGANIWLLVFGVSFTIGGAWGLGLTVFGFALDIRHHIAARPVPAVPPPVAEAIPALPDTFVHNHGGISETVRKEDVAAVARRRAVLAMLDVAIGLVGAEAVKLPTVKEMKRAGINYDLYDSALASLSSVIASKVGGIKLAAGWTVGKVKAAVSEGRI